MGILRSTVTEADAALVFSMLDESVEVPAYMRYETDYVRKWKDTRRQLLRLRNLMARFAPG